MSEGGTDADTAVISGAVTEVEDGSTPGKRGAAGTAIPSTGNPAGPGIVLIPSLGGGAEDRTETSVRTGMLS